MFEFVKQILVSIVVFYGCNVLNVNPLKCFSMNYEECKIRPETINTNSDEPSFYTCSIKISKCSGSWNNINDPYSKLYVPDVVKNMNTRVFTLGQEQMKQDT